ncbi:MAG: TolC family protein [Bacteroidia bacterium]|nr:TolC family protein [Bacteroidia bacterium]
MKKINGTILFLLHVFFLQAQNKPIKLDQVIDSIEKNFPEIIKYESKVQAIQAKVKGAKAWMPPTLSAGPDQFFYNPSLLKDKSDMNRAGITLSVEQMIPNNKKLNAKKNYLQSLVVIQQNNSEWTKNTFRYYARYLYYQRVVAEKTLKLVQENKELLTMLVNSSEAKFPYNQSDLSSIFKAKGKLQELKNMEIMLQASIAESNIGLNTLMNRDVNTSFSIDTGITFKDYEPKKLIYKDTSSIKRSDILSVQNSIKSMKLNKELMSLQRRPDFGAKFNHMQMLGMPNQYSLMGMVTIPVVPWSSKMYKSEVKSMSFEIDAMIKEKEAMQLMALRMINEKLVMLNYGKIQLQNYQSGIIPMYKKNFEANLIAYKQNTGNLFLLLDSWEMLLMKRMGFYNKTLEVIKLEADYEYETELK